MFPKKILDLFPQLSRLVSDKTSTSTLLINYIFLIGESQLLSAKILVKEAKGF